MSELHSNMASRLKALIVEDEWPAREYLIELLLDSQLVHVVAAVATAEEARQALTSGGIEVDVVFVDINLATSVGCEAGLGVVREFSLTPGAPLFVMATALKQHAAEAFDLDAVDYLLKPFSEQRVLECLSRVIRRRARPLIAAPARAVARGKKGLIFIKHNEIWAFEASERLTFLHSAVGRLDFDLSLAVVETTLTGRWLRVHRNWLVNLDHVTGLERDAAGSTLVLGGTGAEQKGGVCAPIARDKIQRVRELLLTGTTGVRR